jgi:hypothetical protein
VADLLNIDESLVWTGDGDTKDFPLVPDDRPDDGPEYAGDVENLLKFLPLFAEMEVYVFCESQTCYRSVHRRT